MDDALTQLRMDAIDCLLRARSAAEVSDLSAAITRLRTLAAIQLPLDPAEGFIISDLETARSLSRAWLELADSGEIRGLFPDDPVARRRLERFQQLAGQVADALYRGRPLEESVRAEVASESAPSGSRWSGRSWRRR